MGLSQTSPAYATYAVRPMLGGVEEVLQKISEFVGVVVGAELRRLRALRQRQQQPLQPLEGSTAQRGARSRTKLAT